MKNLLFYYPQHFNRTKEGSNPFFDKMLEVCDRHGISYDLVEEPDGYTDKPRNPHAIKGDAFFWGITALRKVLPILFPKKEYYLREKIAARIFNCLTFGRYRYRKYITISGSMYQIFAAINPKANVYDMQHGVLYKDHPTFFDHRRLRPQYFRSNLHFLFWGNGYRDIFVKGDEKILAGRTHVVGYPIVTANTRPVLSRKRNIIVSLQFTHDIGREELERDKTALEDFLSETEESGYQVLLKHHPRFNNCICINDLLERYRHVSLTSKSLDELVKEVRLHVTYFSTTAFEYATYGIPTYFFPAAGRPSMYGIFYSEYAYPLYQGMSIKKVLSRIDDHHSLSADSQSVEQWYNQFYTPFDEKLFLELIK